MARSQDNPRTMPIRVVALDGDDTLWHNETRFKLTQTALRDLLRSHVPDADVDRHLFEVEMRNLSLYLLMSLMSSSSSTRKVSAFPGGPTKLTNPVCAISAKRCASLLRPNETAQRAAFKAIRAM